MKVLFVCSGNRGGISPIIKNQGDSLVKKGVSVDYFTIKGKGICGYLRNVKLLRNFLRKNSFDVVHAHYSLSAFVSSLAGVKQLHVSLMGSDVKSSKFYILIIKILASLFYWKSIIVKSQDMYDNLGIKRSVIIPNGIDTERFMPIDKIACLRKLNWNVNKKHILFTSNPERKEKNYELALKAVSLIQDIDVELHYMKDVPNEETPIWYNAADVVLLTSLWEGSPNAIKEAMACDRPIVSTEVGDVKWLLKDVDGCILTNYSPRDCSNKIRLAIQFSIENIKTLGAEKVKKLGLSSFLIAERVISLYR